MKNVVFVIIITLSAFSLLEGVVRLLGLTGSFNADFKYYIRTIDNDLECSFNQENPLLMWSPKPNIEGNNSSGYRDKEYNLEKSSNCVRILCLGDSSTYWGSYHELLEDKLNSAPGKSIKYEVINAGVTGYTSYQGLLMYKYYGEKYSPDIVLFYFGVNDHIKRFYLSDKEVIKTGLPPEVSVVINKYFNKFHTYRLYRKIVIATMQAISGRNKEEVARVSSSEYAENISELNSLVKRNGARLILISPPLNKKYENAEEYRFSQIVHYRSILRKAAQDLSLPLLEIKEMTEESNVPAQHLFSDMVHPNEEGNRLLCDRLFGFLESNALIAF